MSSCGIELENCPSNTILSGQILRGTVRLTTIKAYTVRSVYVKLHGYGRVRWTEFENYETYDAHEKKNVTKQRLVERSREEEYLNQRTFLIPSTGSEMLLTPGTYQYTFENSLPLHLPTSFESHDGHIRYKLSVVLDIPRWPDDTFEMLFTVIAAVSLSADPSLSHPVSYETIETFTPCFIFFCWESGPLQITATTPLGGYIPGQHIDLDILAKNKSDQTVYSFCIRLMQHVSYFADYGHTKSENKIITEKNTTQGCNKNQDVTIKTNFIVPSVPPTDNSSNIIKIRYYIRIKASIAGCHTDPDLELPVTIGTFT